MELDNIYNAIRTQHASAVQQHADESSIIRCAGIIFNYANRIQSAAIARVNSTSVGINEELAHSLLNCASMCVRMSHDHNIQLTPEMIT